MRHRMELLDNDFFEVRNVETDLVMGGVRLCCDPNSPVNDLTLTGCVVINKDADVIAYIPGKTLPLQQASEAVAQHVERSGYAGFKPLNQPPQPLRIEKRLGALMADTALVIARAFVERQNGRVKVETKEKFAELIVELYYIWSPSRFGSYDAERRVHDPYFAHSYPSDPRMRFAAAAVEHGMWEMRARFPGVSDADEAALQKVLWWTVELFERALKRVVPVRLPA